MDYKKVDFEDLIDMSGARNLKPITQRTGQNSPPLIKDIIRQDDIPAKEISLAPINLTCIPISYALPPYIVINL